MFSLVRVTYNKISAEIQTKRDEAIKSPIEINSQHKTAKIRQLEKQSESADLQQAALFTTYCDLHPKQ